MYSFSFDDSIVKYRFASAFIPPERRRFDHRRLPYLPRAKNSVTVHGCKGVGVEGRDIRRPPGRCRSALKIVDYAPQVLFGSSATMLFHSNLGQSALRG